MLDLHEELREKLKSLTSEKTRTKVYKAELELSSFMPPLNYFVPCVIRARFITQEVKEIHLGR